MIRSTIHEYINAYQIEKARLTRKNKKIINKDIKFFIALFRSLLISIIVFGLGGFIALLCYLIAALISKILLETINYVEHYGLVREEGKPVRPRHSWNSNTLISSAFTFNLTRHSAHHEKAHLPYWKLDPYSDAPKMPFGYLTTFFIALLFANLLFFSLLNNFSEVAISYTKIGYNTFFTLFLFPVFWLLFNLYQMSFIGSQDA